MGLEFKINISGMFTIAVLREVTTKEFYDKEWDFIYGSSEYEDEANKILKKIKRQWRQKSLK